MRLSYFLSLVFLIYSNLPLTANAENIDSEAIFPSSGPIQSNTEVTNQSSLDIMSSFENFKANFKIGKISCDPAIYMRKSHLLRDDPMFAHLPSKILFKEHLKTVISEVAYYGIMQMYTFNPELAELTLKNATTFPINYYCDYTVAAVSRAHAYVRPKHYLFGKIKSFNIGNLTPLLLADFKNGNWSMGKKNSGISIRKPDGTIVSPSVFSLSFAREIFTILFHEQLHIYLDPKVGRKSIRHLEKSDDSFVPTYDLVYGVANLVGHQLFSFWNGPLAVPVVKISDLLDKKKDQLDSVAKIANSIQHVIGMSLDLCYAAVQTKVDGDKLKLIVDLEKLTTVSCPGYDVSYQQNLFKKIFVNDEPFEIIF